MIEWLHAARILTWSGVPGRDSLTEGAMVARASVGELRKTWKADGGEDAMVDQSHSDAILSKRRPMQPKNAIHTWWHSKTTGHNEVFDRKSENRVGRSRDCQSDG